MPHRVNQLTHAIAAEKRRGLLFDGAVFLSVGLGAGLIAGDAGALTDTFVGFLLLFALLTQIVGALLKKGPLGRRLAVRERRAQADLLDRFMDGLLVLHFILFTVITLMALALLGVAPGELSDGWVALGLSCGALATFAVWRAAKVGEGSAGATHFSAGTEYLADGLLWISVSIVTHTFWVMLAGDVGVAAGIGLNGRALVLLIALSFLFVAFYLPARYLFLVEDYRSPLTWLQMWLVMLPVARLVLSG